MPCNGSEPIRLLSSLLMSATCRRPSKLHRPGSLPVVSLSKWWWLPLRPSLNPLSLATASPNLGSPMPSFPRPNRSCPRCASWIRLSMSSIRVCGSRLALCDGEGGFSSKQVCLFFDFRQALIFLLQDQLMTWVPTCQQCRTLRHGCYGLAGKACGQCHCDKKLCQDVVVEGEKFLVRSESTPD